MQNPAYVVDFEKESELDKTNKTFQPISTITHISHTYEEAITLTGVGRFQYVLLLICGITFLAVMCEMMGVSVIMPSMKCDLASTISQQGLLASAGFFGVVLSSHAMGFLADTWGRVRTLRYALILSSISTVISAFSVNIWMMIAFRFLSGFFISGGQACALSLCGEFHGNKTRVRHVTLLAGFLPLGLIYLPTVAIFLLPIRLEVFIFGMKFSSWRLLLLSNFVMSMIALIGLLTLPETPKYVLVQGNHDGALHILRKIYVKNTGHAPEDYPVKNIILQTNGASLTNIHGFKDAVKMIWTQTAPLFNRERFLHTINICVSQFIVYGITQGIFMWFPTILNEMISKNDQHLMVCNVLDNVDKTANHGGNICEGELDRFLFYVLISIGVVFSLFYLFTAFTVDFFGKKNLLLAWLIISGASSISLHWISDFALAVILITLVMSVGNCAGVIGAIAMEFYPTNINAMGMCFIMMIGRLGAVAGSNMMGQFLFLNCNLVFWMLLCIAGLLSVMCIFLPDRKHKKNQIICLKLCQ